MSDFRKDNLLSVGLAWVDDIDLVVSQASLTLHSQSRTFSYPQGKGELVSNCTMPSH